MRPIRVAEFEGRGGMTRKQARAAVLERDGYKCTECGKTNEQHIEETGRSLECHRIVPGSLYSVPGCRTLCHRCHLPQPQKPRGTPDLEGGVEFECDPEWAKRLRAQAKRFAINAANYIRQAVTKEIEADEANDPKW